MGAVGAGSFENDDALDWLGEFLAEGDPEAVREALEPIPGADQGDYLEAPGCSAALAAAEVLATAGGRPPPDVPPELAEWVQDRKPAFGAGLYNLALAAIARITSGSELAELWAEGDDSEWRAAVEDLEKRLRSARPPS